VSVEGAAIPFEPPRPPVLAEPSNIFRVLAHLGRLRRGELDIVSVWPEWGFTAKFRKVHMLRRWLFIAISPDAVRHVLIDNAANYPKSELMERALRELVGHGMFINNGPDWAWRRELAQAAFTGAHLPALADVVPGVAAEIVARWETLPDGSVVDITAEMTAATAEVVCRGLFSVALGPRRARELALAFTAYQDEAGHLDLGFMLRLPLWARRPAPRARAAARRIHAVLESVIAERASVHPERRDYFDLLREGKDALRDAPLTAAQIRDEAAVMLLAGHETSASALSWAFYLLSQSPDVEARLVDEIADQVGGRAPLRPDLPKLRYAEAVMAETLRLYPPVAVLPREAIAEDTIRDQRIPAHSAILVPTWLIHRHADHWRQPHAFRPERFLDPAERPASRFAYLPFGVGPRTCLGASLAMMEATLFLTTLSRRFRFALPEGEIVTAVCQLTTRPKGGLRLRISRRGPVPAP